MLQTRLKMTPDRAVFTVIIILLLAAGVWVAYLSRQLSSARQAAKVQTVVVQRDKVLNADSVRTAAEGRVRDSVQAVITNLQTQLKVLRNENTKIKAHNAAISIDYDTIDIVRPDF